MWDVLVIQTENILNIKRLRQESHQRLCVCAWARVYVLEYIFKSVNVKCRINEIQSTKLDVIRTISVCFYKSLRSRRIKTKDRARLLLVFKQQQYWRFKLTDNK